MSRLALKPVQRSKTADKPVTRQATRPDDQKAAHKPAFMQPKLAVSQPGDAQERQSVNSAASDIRIHDNTQSQHLTQSLGTNAFSTGSDIYFKEGRYSDHLPAHELTRGKVGPLACEDTEDMRGTRSPRQHFDELALEPRPWPDAAAAAQAHEARGLGALTAPLEAAFGADLTSVALFRDGRADAIGAQAFAQGEDVHLARDAPGLNSDAGRSLLGHEIAHVMQQREGRVAAPQGKGAPVVVDSGLEAEADVAGTCFARGEAVPAAVGGGSAGGSASIGVGGLAAGKTEGQPIQLFGAVEHMLMGNSGAQQQPYRWDTANEAASGIHSPDVGFVLSHGDIVMLSGDLFDPRETDEHGAPVPDNLFKLAREPGRYGDGVGTQDEIMYAIYKERPSDPRFKNVCWVPGGVDLGGPAPSVTFPLKPDPENPFQPYFSDEVKKTVDMRYLNLAANNREHFARPDGDWSGGPRDGDRRSAGGTYRAMHETAIRRAFLDGLAGQPLDAAMAYEAAAQHYLTDSFSAGHIRTPTGLVKTHWDGVYPNFWPNLKRFIAHQMAEYMNANETNGATLLGTVAAIEGDIISSLEAKVAPYPALGFERLVALATHDVDNETGIQVTNDLGEKWTAYGDGQMKQPDHGTSQERAIEAVALGCQDIREAHTLPMIVVDPHASLKVGGDRYRPEQKMPRVDPERDKSKLDGWQAADIDDLWDNQIRTDGQLTYGTKLEASAADGDIAEQIGGMAAMIDDKQEVWKDTIETCDSFGEMPSPTPSCRMNQVYLGTLNPKAAFKASVAAPIQGKTKATLKLIVDFNPSAGQAWFNQDDSVMEELARMEKRDQDDNAARKDGRTNHDSMRGLSLSQRATWIENIMDGIFAIVFEDEEERIAQLFETCPAAQRPLLYRMIEGHEWNGNYREGWFTLDDDLYNSLSGVELRKVRDLINEGR